MPDVSPVLAGPAENRRKRLYSASGGEDSSYPLHRKKNLP